MHSPLSRRANIALFALLSVLSASALAASAGSALRLLDPSQPAPGTNVRLKGHVQVSADQSWQHGYDEGSALYNAGKYDEAYKRWHEALKLAEAQRQIALVEYEKAIQTAFRETSDALVEQRKVREIRAERELLVATLRDRSRLAYLRYRGGVDTLLNALDADRDLFNAELNLAQTRRDELLALVRLYKALGGGWQQ